MHVVVFGKYDMVFQNGVIIYNFVSVQNSVYMFIFFFRIVYEFINDALETLLFAVISECENCLVTTCLG